MASTRASWKHIANSSDIRRSSQVISVAHDRVSIFGGEIKPRQPVDNKLYSLSIDNAATSPQCHDSAAAPSPRVGSASCTISGKTYIFSGRGGEAMAPIEELGAIHVLDAQTGQWTTIEPADPAAPFPPARSYHAMASDGADTIYLHAGCPEKGRLSDLWAFDLTARAWKQLPSAPGPARGGASLAFADGRLYRMNGFDGQHEQGLALDTYHVDSGLWTTLSWDAGSGPPPRSVSALLPLSVRGKPCLLTLFGESDPSNLGHQGAGRMLDDVWVFDVAAESWRAVEVEGERPQARGWFAADVVPGKRGGSDAALVHGGLAEDNSRLGDVWVLSV